jgi:hypothetical protein
MAEDIHAFLLARYSEEKELAIAAGSTRGGKIATWRVDHLDCSHGPDSAGDCYARRIEGDNITIYDEGGHDEDQARFIARWDPAAVLADIEIKLEILSWHVTCDKVNSAREPGKVIDVCWCGLDQPCGTKRYMAVLYSGHGDYNPDWRVA